MNRLSKAMMNPARDSDENMAREYEDGKERESASSDYGLRRRTVATANHRECRYDAQGQDHFEEAGVMIPVCIGAVGERVRRVA